MADGERSLHLNDRDHFILEAVGKMRFSTTTQLTRLFFTSRYGANKRLRELFDAGLLQVWVRSLEQENVYSLTQKGRKLLKMCNGSIRIPRSLDGNLNHLLATNEVRIALAAGLPVCGGWLEWWQSDWELKRIGGNAIPDALFAVSWEEENRNNICALEVENETRSPQAFLKKALRYRSAVASWPFSAPWLLVVGLKIGWLEKYRLALGRSGLYDQAVFCSLEDLREAGVSACIWKTALDERTYSLRDLLTVRRHAGL